MADEKTGDKPAEKSVVIQPQPKIFKVFGREFDVSSDKGIQDASLWAEAHESARGKMAHELGDLRKEVEPLRRYNLKKATLDEIGLREKVATLREEGNHVAADNLLFEFGKQSRLAIDAEREKERLWNDYRRSRKDLFENIDEDLARTYVFANYADKLEESEDPVALMDRILQPKASKARPVEVPPAVLGSGTPPPPVEPKAEPELSPMAKVMEEFGFK